MENAFSTQPVGAPNTVRLEKNEDGPNVSPSLRFVSLLNKKFIQNNPKKEIADIPDQDSINNLLNARTEEGNYSAEITFDKTRLAITQSNTDTNTLHIRDMSSGKKCTLTGLSFELLQKKMLQQYIHGHRHLHFTVNLSVFDLTKIDLSDIDLTHTIINRRTFDAMVASGLDVRGTTLAAGQDTTGLNLAGVALDQPLTESLLKAGADFKTVLAAYLASPPGTFSHVFKSALLSQYIELESVHNNFPIDLSLFDLRNVCFNGINLGNTILSNENLKAIIAAGGNLKSAALTCAPNIIFDENGMTQQMAIELIKAGVNRHFVLTVYLDSERAKKNPSINIDGLNLTKEDLEKLNLRNVDLSGIQQHRKEDVSTGTDIRHKRFSYRRTSFRNMESVKICADQLFRFEGQLRVGKKQFRVSIVRGQAKVEDVPKKTGWFSQLWWSLSGKEPSSDAKELERILNSSRTRNEDIAKMTHAALPSALRHMTQDQWGQLGNSVAQAIRNDAQPNFLNIVHAKFYQDIYKNASSNVRYEYTKPEQVRKKEWRALIANAIKNRDWTPIGNKYAKRQFLQISDETTDSISKAKLGLAYNNKSNTNTISRLQFVVSSEAGPALYFDLANLMDQYIDNELNGDPTQCPVQFFKVFSEDGQAGQSDSAVFYLSCPLDDDRVKKLVSYLERRLENRLVAMPIIGTTSLGHGYIFGTMLPDKGLEKKLIGSAKSSNGGLIRNILATAYQQAYSDALLNGVKREEINAQHLNQRAQYYANEIWHELGLAHKRSKRVNAS